MLRITRIDPEPFFTPNIHLVTHNDLFEANRRSLIPLSERLWHGRSGVTLGHQVTQAVRFLILHRFTFGSLCVPGSPRLAALRLLDWIDRKSTRLNSSHVRISYAVFCL